VRSTQNVFNRLGPGSFNVQVDASGAHAGDNDSLPITVTSTDPEARDADAVFAVCGEKLGGMREEAIDALPAPLLPLFRGNAAYVAEHGLKFREDASNADVHHHRNKMPPLDRGFSKAVTRRAGICSGDKAP